jgi:hypothetical protein
VPGNSDYVYSATVMGISRADVLVDKVGVAISGDKVVDGQPRVVFVDIEKDGKVVGTFYTGFVKFLNRKGYADLNFSIPLINGKEVKTTSVIRVAVVQLTLDKANADFATDGKVAKIGDPNKLPTVAFQTKDSKLNLPTYHLRSREKIIWSKLSCQFVAFMHHQLYGRSCYRKDTEKVPGPYYGYGRTHAAPMGSCGSYGVGVGRHQLCRSGHGHLADYHPGRHARIADARILSGLAQPRYSPPRWGS